MLGTGNRVPLCCNGSPNNFMIQITEFASSVPRSNDQIWRQDQEIKGVSFSFSFLRLPCVSLEEQTLKWKFLVSWHMAAQAPTDFPDNCCMLLRKQHLQPASPVEILQPYHVWMVEVYLGCSEIKLQQLVLKLKPFFITMKWKKLFLPAKADI